MSASVSMGKKLDEERELLCKLTLPQLEALASASEALIDRAIIMARNPHPGNSADQETGIAIAHCANSPTPAINVIASLARGGAPHSPDCPEEYRSPPKQN
jgi:hypothetical protein